MINRSKSAAQKGGYRGTLKISHFEKMGTPLDKTIVSPRLNELRQVIEVGNIDMLADFWQEISEQGTPLIEAIEADDQHVLVTFLWRSDEEIDNVVVIGQLSKGQNFAENRMRRLLNTDLWYKTYKLRNDLRAAYCLSPDDSLIPFHEVEDWSERTATWQHDPFNPRTLKVPEHAHTLLSVLELPNARPQHWAALRPGVPAGEIVTHHFTSNILNNERNIWIYLPPGYTVEGEPYSLLLLFDGWAYLDVIQAPTTLDNLLADNLIPPLVAVFLDIVDFGVRSRELPCYPPFVDFVAQELIPWIDQHYHITANPAQRVIGGFSFGGLAAAFVGLNRSELFGNILSQSGSFWWKPEGEIEHEWLTHQFAISHKRPLSFYLDVGLLETDCTYDNGPSMLVVNRHMRNVLQAKDYPVHYAEYAGGHDYLYWRGSLADGLLRLIGITSERNHSVAY